MREIQDEIIKVPWYLKHLLYPAATGGLKEITSHKARDFLFRS